MISQVDICNLALTHLGVKPITSLEDSSAPARALKLIFNNTRDAVLRAHNWNFASKTEALAEISGEPVLGWSHLYKYPSNALFIRKIMNDQTLSITTPQEFKECLSPRTNQKAIAAKIPLAYAEFTVRITDSNSFDANFVDALSYRLAATLAQPLTGDAGMGSRLLGVYDVMIRDAHRANMSEGTESVRRTSSFVDVRG
jgi:hypothetical protein